MASKLLYIKTFGCQMNVHDTQRMHDVLRPQGYRPAATPEQADVILINTCTVREKSRAKVLSAVGRYARLKARSPHLVLGVAGCVAQQDGDSLLGACADLDLVFSPDHIADLPLMIQRASRRRTVVVGHTPVEQYTFLQSTPSQPRDAGGGPTALVTIQKGCDNHCSYCVVPSVRGPEVSRPGEEILQEVQQLVAAGAREVTLIGQNVNSYRGLAGGEDDFVQLLRLVDACHGLQRIRFTTSHPKDFSEALARAMASLPAVCPWLHLPVQSGSTRVLELMNRGYSREHYLGLVDLVRQHCPQITLGTDIIVGYPGETEQEFQQTLSLLDRVQYDTVYSFKYSVRPGTTAADQPDDVPEADKARRLAQLQGRQDEITRQRLARFVGQTLQVLVEGPSRRGLPQLSGRSPGNHVVNLEPAAGNDPLELVGQLVPVSIIRAGGHSLHGALAGLEG